MFWDNLLVPSSKVKQSSANPCHVTLWKTENLIPLSLKDKFHSKVSKMV